MIEIQGYNEALCYLERYNRSCKIERISELLDETIAHMTEDEKITSYITAGFLVKRDFEGNLEVWVNPNLFARFEGVSGV